MSPKIAYPFRAFLLRLFGAKVGVGCVIRPSAKITYPWNIEIGDHVWIGDDVVLYSLGAISIGSNSVISQNSYICAADHLSDSIDFAIRSNRVEISSEVWIATDVFVAPGVSIARGVVVGARSSVFKDLQEGMICFGNPCVPIRKRSTSAIPSQESDL